MRRVSGCPVGCPLASSWASEIARARVGSWPGVPTTLLTPDWGGRCGGAAGVDRCCHRGSHRDIKRGGPSPADIAWPVASSHGSAAPSPCPVSPMAVPTNEAVTGHADGHVEACPHGRGGGAA